MTTAKWIIASIVCAGSLTACKPKAPEGSTTGTTAAQVTAPAEVVVTTEIPDDLRVEASAEITAANADEAAAKLEAEIDADL